MSVVVTGATGQLGHHIVASLLERGVPADEITATGRSVEKAADLAAAGVTVVASDYTDPASLDAAFAGADVLVLVSGSEIGQRSAQHQNAVDAAVRAGVGRIVYTSIPKASETPMILAQEHRATEAAIVASGLPYTFVRNAWYVENYLPQIPTWLEHGVVGAAGEGRVSLATRRDYAEAAAVVASTDGHVNAVYELGGESLTLAELAALVGEASGQDVAYTDVDEDTLRGILVTAAGFPEPVAAVYADVDSRIKAGDLHVTSGDLERLIGHAPEAPADSVKGAVAAL
ncbi:MAG TPA: SDR family oxidoreductase [Candidatus Nanopelagicales bacterium]|nr:SDR family oxidoreductase [Candidatus Nanopelagicales bacterium]